MGFMSVLAEPIFKILDKVVPDAAQRDQIKLQLLQQENSHEVETLKAQLSAIVAEAQSTDPWTSRARPSFLYVMYLLILLAVPMGVLSAFNPDAAAAISKGMTGYLSAIPEPLYVLFGTGYLGYTAARQWGKAKGTDK